MNIQERHNNYLKEIKSHIRMADSMLTKENYLDTEQHESVSQNKAILEMRFEAGIKAFQNPLGAK